MTDGMQPDAFSLIPPSSTPDRTAVDPAPVDAAERLSASARGWHSIQLAVLGFIGICGVLRTGATDSAPEVLQWLSTALAVLALLLACVSTYKVGRVAYPFYGAGPAEGDVPKSLHTLSAELRSGIRLTFVAVAMLAIASVVSWWPSDAGVAQGVGWVEIRDAKGGVACGTILSGSGGILRLQTAQGDIAAPLNAIATIRPVTSC
jgi:hypothetical protein